ncbi:rRNA maturation RNase YbeY [Sphingomonas sp. RRHST34]|uniref:Endoribonuclease YbeY n=1 Tax=Sphingomonas citri TaxID=2862499 RepID=A0ABS7BNI9_9SPHN|nr:rRNA maturation RNase YbeY [Sphingomonas citri]MBW6531080.1 rRNA maturation RNase YbeY [Sphingomonas citri]
MIHVELTREEAWPDEAWEQRALAATRAAVAHTPHGELLTTRAAVEVSVRLTDDAEVHALNRQYRGKDKPTNVLSFPMVQPDLLATVSQNSDDGELLLGDIVLAHGVCAREAAERGIAVADHFTHLVVHGTLHLLGYDHMTDEEGDAMEEIERAALADLGVADPYLIRED